MNRLLKTGLAALAFATLGAGSLMAGDEGGREGKNKIITARADLVGYQEVPAVSTLAWGNFRAEIDTVANTISYTLRYEALEGTVQQSHVHFGQKSVNGGISFFLCTNLGNGPVGTQACPPPPAEISGIITPAEIVGPAGQGIDAMSFAEIVAAIADGTAYANVHSSKWQGGEIRGQLK